MKSEREANYDWGESWVSHYLVDGIERLLTEKKIDGRGILIKNYERLILEPLVERDISPDLINHINIEFVKPDTSRSLPDEADEALKPVMEILTAEFGHEVIKRIKVTLSKEMLRDCCS